MERKENLTQQSPWHRFRKNPLSMGGLIIILVGMLSGLLGYLLPTGWTVAIVAGVSETK